MKEPIDYTALFLFSGMGLGARGFLEASAKYLGHEARFRSVGGIDNDPGACADFEYFTESPALCCDLKTLTPAELRAFAGIEPPDAVFFSAPCKAFSRLLNPKRRQEPKYVEMARLALDAVELMVSTWDIPPRLLIFENVTGIVSLGAKLLAEIRQVLTDAGYLLGERTYDCGEIGGLAQHRRRFLLVARHPGRVMARLEEPPKQRVKAIGEVLSALPLPLGSELPMHTLSALHWKTWVQLSQIMPRGFVWPDGRVSLGDYRDLAGVVPEGAEAREVRARDRVLGWEEPSFTVSASTGANVTVNVADPMVRDDPRLAVQEGNAGTHENKFRVTAWDRPAHAVIGATRVGSGAPSVADPRAVEIFRGSQGVLDWNAAAGTITSGGRPSKGAFSVADPRLPVKSFDHGYRVLSWGETSFTVAGQTAPGQGAYTVADPRIDDLQLGCSPRAGAYGVIGWEEAIGTIAASADVHNGAYAIADPRVPGAPPVAFIDSPKRSPFLLVEEPGKTARSKARWRRVAVPVVIVSPGRTWNRPLSPRELAALQDAPMVVRGEPMRLAGDSVEDWIERIGNAVPRGAARALAGQFLLTLIASDRGAGLLPVGGLVWVNPEHENRHPFLVGLGGVLIPVRWGAGGCAETEEPRAGGWLQ